MEIKKKILVQVDDIVFLFNSFIYDNALKYVRSLNK